MKNLSEKFRDCKNEISNILERSNIDKVAKEEILLKIDRFEQDIDDSTIENLVYSAEKNEKFNEPNYKKFFDSLNHPFIIGHTSAHFIVVNKYFANMLGYENPEEINGRSFYDFIHHDDINSTVSAQKVLEKNKINDGISNIISFENRYKKKSGEYIWLNWKAVQLEDNYYAMTELSDISNEFLSKLAHEIRTPLNVILGFSELLTLDESIKNESQTNLKMIVKSCESLNTLITELLDISRSEISKLNVVEVDLHDEIIHIIKSFGPELVKKKISLKFYEKHSHYLVKCDTSKFAQIMKNLISNAIKYNKENGLIIINCEYFNKKMKISVRDTGIGIPESQIKNLYKPFHRLGRNTEYEGTGIGLSLVKKLVNLFDGTIICNSTEGEGSEFIIEFEANENDKSYHEGIFTIFNNETKILYIEDVETNIKIIEQMLRKLDNIRFYYSKTGEEGLEMIKENPPDILLLDLGLPGIRGEEVFEKAKQEGRLKNTKVCVVSAEGRSQKIDSLFKSGIDEYMPKPVRIKPFLEYIQNNSAQKV